MTLIRVYMRESYPGQAGWPHNNACYDALWDFERKSLDNDFDM